MDRYSLLLDTSNIEKKKLTLAHIIIEIKGHSHGSLQDTTRPDIRTALDLRTGVQVLEQSAARSEAQLGLLLPGLQGSSPPGQSLPASGQPAHLVLQY